MRRLVLVLAAFALLCAPSAGAATTRPWATVVDGAAHRAGAKVKGWFAVKNTAKRTAHRGKVYVLVGNGRGARSIGYRTAPALRPGRSRRFAFSYPLPKKLAAGEWRINACTGGACLRVGHFWIVGAGSESSSGDEGSSSGSTPISTVPTDPISHPVDEPFGVDAGSVHYYGFVPGSYDQTNQTPTRLLVWLHGCHGEAEGDAWVVDPGAEGEPQDWLTLSLAGREGGGEGVCWTPSVDEAKVMAALADFETHFNVDRRRVILAGYSSGGDLAYRTGFRHSSTFAGLLIENSTPFRDTESSAAESLAAATTKFHIVALAHEEDTTYPLATVEKETSEVKAAGFPLTLIKRPGEHWNEPGEVVAGEAVPGTDADLRTYLLPHIDDGWLAPVQ
ncbi:MAG: hypothetical protein QM729_20280 [Solirubrobacterales bacterium]